jgi:hypothetical protein
MALFIFCDMVMLHMTCSKLQKEQGARISLHESRVHAGNIQR